MVDAKKVADYAHALEIYAKRQELSQDAIDYAHAVKVDAMTMMGEFLKTAEKRGPEHSRGGGSSGSKREPLPDAPPTLAALGMGKRESSDAQALVEIKEEAPDLHDAVRAGQMTIPNARAAKKRREKKAAEPEPAAVVPTSSLWRIDKGDCLSWFAAQPADAFDLVFGSPPYEEARLYLEEGEDSGIARKTDEWVAWMVEVYQAALRCCTGLVAFVVEGSTKKYRWSAGPTLLMADLHRAGITLRKPPIYQRVGIPGSGGPDWLRNDYEFIVCATRGGPLPWSDNTALGSAPKYPKGGEPSHRRTNGSRVNRGSGHTPDEERKNAGPHRARTQSGESYNPPEKANPGNVVACIVGGGTMGDPLCHENEAPFPESLAEFFVRSFCRPGGLVCDPFSGSGTTAKVAIQAGRRFHGCDLRQSQVNLTRRRLAHVQQLLPMEV